MRHAGIDREDMGSRDGVRLAAANAAALDLTVGARCGVDLLASCYESGTPLLDDHDIVPVSMNLRGAAGRVNRDLHLVAALIGKRAAAAARLFRQREKRICQGVNLV